MAALGAVKLVAGVCVSASIHADTALKGLVLKCACWCASPSAFYFISILVCVSDPEIQVSYINKEGDKIHFNGYNYT